MGNGSKYLKTWQQHEAGMSSVFLAYLGPVLHVLQADKSLHCSATFPSSVPVLAADECRHHPFHTVFIMLLIHHVADTNSLRRQSTLPFL